MAMSPTNTVQSPASSSRSRASKRPLKKALLAVSHRLQGDKSPVQSPTASSVSAVTPSSTGGESRTHFSLDEGLEEVGEEEDKGAAIELPWKAPEGKMGLKVETSLSLTPRESDKEKGVTSPPRSPSPAAVPGEVEHEVHDPPPLVLESNDDTASGEGDWAQED
jgi:hypothetical protein